METLDRKKIAVCETQPLTAEGLRSLVEASAEFDWLRAVSSLDDARDLVWMESPDVLVVDKALGMQSVLEALSGLRGRQQRTSVVVWGVSMSQAEALRFLQAGAKGIVRKAAPPDLVIACLRSACAGVTWMEDAVFHQQARIARSCRSDLTAREQQVMELIEQGFKNKDIARELGIRPGTVKIHLKHIFEKTGVRGRYGLALTGMRDRGNLALV